MEVAIRAGLLTKGDMKIDSSQRDLSYELLIILPLPDDKIKPANIAFYPHAYFRFKYTCEWAKQI
jgi:hypothetical protein